MKNTTKLLLGGLLLSGIGVTTFLGSTFQTESIETYTPRVNSPSFGKTANMQAIDLYEELRKNVNTGKIEGSDFTNAWNAVKNMPASRSSILTLKDEGPDNVGGRTRAILIDHRGRDTVYAGSVSGGLFKSTNRGNTWSRVNAFSNVLSISCMAQTQDGTIYVGTGHHAESSIANGGSGGHRANGVYYTTDGGGSFTQLTPTPSWGTNAVNSMHADPNENDVVYVAGYGSIRVTKVENKTNFSVVPGLTGVVQAMEMSKDGNVFVAASGSRTFVKEGSSGFVKVSGTGAGQIKETASTPITRIEYAISHEKNANGKYSIYASMVRSGSIGILGGISASHDNGQTWQEVVPETPTSVTVASTVLTTDPFANGSQWQGNYDNIITVIPGSPKQFIVGGINLHRWTESSTAAPFGQMAQVSSSQANATSSFYAHADQHDAIWDNSNRLYIGNDGGVGISDNATSANIRYYPANRGYSTVQFYGIAYSKYGDVAGGAQDNGTKYKELSSPGTSPREFKDANHSDGFDCEISHLNNDIIISSRQNMEVDRSTAKATTRFNPSILSPEMVALTDNEKPFNTVLRIYENGNDLNSTDSLNYYATENKAAGETITVTSKNLDVQFDYVLTAPLRVVIDTAVDALGDTSYSYSYRDTLRVQDVSQTLLAVGGQGSGGLWVTRGALRTGVTPIWWKVMSTVSGRVTELEFSKDGDILYVAQSGGRVTRIKGFNGLYYKDENHDTINGINDHDRAAYNYADIRSGVTQLQIQTIYTGGFVTGMGVDPNNAEHVVITLGGYGRATNILKSTTAASTTSTSSFIDISGNLPIMPAYDAAIDMSDPNRLIVGTEFGAYVSLNGGGSWSAQNDEMGVVPVYDVRQQYRPWTECFNSGAIYLGTHGRGIWSSTDFLGTDELEKEEATTISAINLYPNPVVNFTNVKFDLTNTADVTISVFSLTGQLVANQTLSNRQAGEITHRINTSDLPKGVYFVNIQAEGNKFKAAKFIKQ